MYNDEKLFSFNPIAKYAKMIYKNVYYPDNLSFKLYIYPNWGV